MASLPYFINYDKTGFPLIRREDWGFWISLLPVSKYQFERFLVEHGPRGELFSDAWYREFLRENPRSSWRDTSHPWRLFMTGVRIEEIELFLRFLGADFRLPRRREWLKLHRASSKDLRRLEISGPAPLRLWLGRLSPPLTSCGLWEWVEDGGRLKVMGRPYHELLPNTFNPDEAREIDFGLCKGAVGFRVVKEGKKW